MSVESKNCEGNFPDRGDFEAIKNRLLEGNERFRELDGKKPVYPNQGKTRRKCLADNGQQPFAIILSCSDSRVPPEFIFDTGLGDLFVVRVAGNIADTAAIGSIEFAVRFLECRYILVLGHEACAAVGSAVPGNSPVDPESDILNDLGNLLDTIEGNFGDCEFEFQYPTKDENGVIVKDYKNEAILKENAIAQRNAVIANTIGIQNTLSKNSTISDPELNVKIERGYYNLISGEVEFNLESGCN